MPFNRAESKVTQMYFNRQPWLTVILFLLLFFFPLPVLSNPAPESTGDVEVVTFSYVPQQPQAGETVEMSGAVKNRSDSEFQVEVAFEADGKKIRSFSLILKPGEKKDVNYDWVATQSVQLIEMSVEKAESVGSDESSVNTDGSTPLVSGHGQWEGETSLTAEDIRKLKNWPDTLLDWWKEVWAAISRWFERVFGQ